MHSTPAQTRLPAAAPCFADAVLAPAAGWLAVGAKGIQTPSPAFGRKSVVATALSACVLGLSYSALSQAEDAAKAACDPYTQYACLDTYLGEGFWTRLVNDYRMEMGQSAAPADPNAAPSRREDFPPAAQSTPPMPFLDWPYGGTNPLGASLPNAMDSPLMNALAPSAAGQWMSERHIQTYGWMNLGGNLSTSSTRGGNAPAAYDYNPNALDLNQLTQTLERIPDMVQKDHNDWGFRIWALYGSDYRYTTSYGLGSNQLTGKNEANGFDVPMLYADWYTPFVAQGLNIRVGRYLSIPDIEGAPAPYNYLYSHSMTYSFDSVTNEGILASLALDKNWIVQAAVTVGTETTLPHLWQHDPNPYPNPLYSGSRFARDPGAKPSGSLSGRWNSDDGKTSVMLLANGINNGTWGYNNLQWYGLTFYHTFNEKWHIAAELYNEHQNSVPNISNPEVQTIVANGGTPFASMAYNAPNMARCGNTAVLSCTAQASGFVTYINYSWNPLNNISLRPEIYQDPQGQRTGTATNYHNLALGWQHWLSPQIEIRPEIAYYHANAPAFNGNPNYGIAPTKTAATIVSADLIYHW
jgi:Putative beta-barrel porin-2, OmpL-like. bbp2